MKIFYIYNLTSNVQKFLNDFFRKESGFNALNLAMEF